ncbi:MAG TPA: fructose-6-phosphate aldolase [Candidatus Bipolaricaulis anaerobius]|jgi:transaldolase|nr:fructose-6-phosphate aldolase [Candidatus Bipolaricaulis sp.]MDD2912278.1 fructose-6-phosphate aldolase [Candidatus Bipolaricaulis anaerobius]MDD3748339.1 fructose-6-phosphate aldolase [Candidatus Bipolaricaulis anaerobius]MDD5764132.1 fructose-6-phosphate aldolase [Candidatus Bipolaricaulis anaerobius]HNR24857.1 fructose-6-phosphate aldolase [Candidatus Bipolaricaulis anaerobius]
MKLYLDTANVAEIRELSWLVDGVTTNPSLVAREKRPFSEVLGEICGIVRGPVSAEVVALDRDGMIREARELARVAPNVVVKIPMTEAGMQAVQALAREGVPTNVTLVFSANQALLAAKCGATYVSPFVGRIDDAGGDGMGVVAEILPIYRHYGFPTEVIVASVRHPGHVLQAALLGAPIATVPYEILKKLFGHPLTEAGIARFLKDWQKVPKA